MTLNRRNGRADLAGALVLGLAGQRRDKLVELALRRLELGELSRQLVHRVVLDVIEGGIGVGGEGLEGRRVEALAVELREIPDRALVGEGEMLQNERRLAKSSNNG